MYDSNYKAIWLEVKLKTVKGPVVSKELGVGIGRDEWSTEDL